MLFALLNHPRTLTDARIRLARPRTATWPKRRTLWLVAAAALAVGLMLGAQARAQPAASLPLSPSFGVAGQATLARTLIGHWRADVEVQGFTPAHISLLPAGVAWLAPDGLEPVTGTWRLADGALAMNVPGGIEAHIDFALEGDRLSLSYAPGITQHFRRLRQAPPGAPALSASGD